MYLLYNAPFFLVLSAPYKVQNSPPYRCGHSLLAYPGKVWRGRKLNKRSVYFILDSSMLLDYMSKRPKFYGERWQHITDADHSYLAKCFTDSVLTHLDLSSVVALPFTEVVYVGKGDPSCVLVDPDYCFTDKQITDLMDFLCCIDCDDVFQFFLTDYVSFKIEMYLLRSISLYKNWIYCMRVAVSKGDI